MMKTTIFVGLALLISHAAYAESETHWTYSGDEGPTTWAELSPEFSDCDGMNQSPIDLTGFIEADLEPIRFAYQAGGNEILNNGHTVQVNYAEGSSIDVDGIRFRLKQFHFHAPSENLIDGNSYPMEAHLVHADDDGNLAVVAVMFIEGQQSTTLAQAWPQMPENPGDKHVLSSPVAAEGLLPPNRDHYRFNGSLTTPPCSEGVRWLVMKQPATASKEQIRAFTDVMHHPNNRPLQATNARTVLQ